MVTAYKQKMYSGCYKKFQDKYPGLKKRMPFLWVYIESFLKTYDTYVI